jgi:hypothetical protein
VTAPITLAGLPEGGKVLILEPEPFSGPLHSGQRVPLGALKVVVTSPGAPPREARLVGQHPQRSGQGLDGGGLGRRKAS